jgi:hypothetical protein
MIEYTLKRAGKLKKLKSQQFCIKINKSSGIFCLKFEQNLKKTTLKPTTLFSVKVSVGKSIPCIPCDIDGGA